MDHQYYQDRLSAYADHELPEAERALLDTHMVECAECRARLSELNRLSELVEKHSPLGESEYWESAAARIENALPDKGRLIDLSRERARRSTLWWKVPAIAASVLIIGYIGLHESDILKDEMLVPPRSAPEQPVRLSTPSADTSPTAPDTGRPGDDVAGSRVLREDVAESTADRGQVPVKVESKTALQQKAAAPKGDTPETAKPETTPQPSAMPPEPVSLQAETEAKDIAESNYVERSRERAPASQGETVSHEEQRAAQGMSTSLSKEADVPTEDLALWRQKRDSLIAAISKLSDTSSKPLSDALKFSAVPPTSGEKAGPLSLAGRQSDTKAQRELAEKSLMEVWYAICRYSPDSTEVNRGMDYFKSVATDTKSGNRSRAQVYLEELEKQGVGRTE
ncbi:MAG: zf-HC2 domain-containing protein [Candidatus Zixiibacteriota bacterium]